MTIEIWFAYVTLVLVLMATPGPSQMLMLSNSMHYGFSRSLLTAAGDLTANSFQMLIAGFGLASIVVRYGNFLTVVQWLGALYLCWMGYQMFKKASGRRILGHSNNASVSKLQLWTSGFLTSVANPKAIVFFAALFPQFIAPDQPFAHQFLLLSATYLILDGSFLCAYGFSADYVTKRFSGNVRRCIEQGGGLMLIAAAILLGAKQLL